MRYAFTMCDRLANTYSSRERLAFGIEEQESLVDPKSYRLARLQIDTSVNVDQQEFNRSNHGMVTLVEPKTEVDQLCEVALLRSVDWIEDHDAEVGGTIFLDMPEMGVEGWAEVLDIEACPELEVGNGQRITGTFKHTSGEVYDLKLESESEPIGVTAQHPFWSVDRNDWVSAIDLKIDETLKTLDGTTVVESLIQRPEPEPVYNIEVENDHVYRVGESGVLVHNSSERDDVQSEADRCYSSSKGGNRPGTVAVLELANGGGQYWGQSSENVDLHPVIEKAYGDLPANERETLIHMHCAETETLSRACFAHCVKTMEDALALLKGSTIRTANVRGPNAGKDPHGSPKDPCKSCRNVLRLFDVYYRE